MLCAKKTTHEGGLGLQKEGEMGVSRIAKKKHGRRKKKNRDLKLKLKNESEKSLEVISSGTRKTFLTSYVPRPPGLEA